MLWGLFLCIKWGGESVAKEAMQLSKLPRTDEWPRSLNSSEYETGSDYLGSNILGGNYGVTYTVTVTNAANKSLEITPNWAAGATAADLVLWNSTYGWFRPGKITSGYRGFCLNGILH